MNHIKEFSKHSLSYDENASIQKEVANHLVSKIASNPRKIIDLGCGTGYVHQALSWDFDSFHAVDSASGMCQLHPTDEKTTIENVNFEAQEFQEKTMKESFDIVISSSALQWAKDLDTMFAFSSKIAGEIAFAIFTNNTFKDIYNINRKGSFLPKKENILQIGKKYFNFTKEVKNYKLNFEDNLSLFRYIKKSGVSGGEKRLNYSETKALLKNYPHKFLEFEVIFLWGKSRKR